jgi:hypothetical protein
MATKTKFQHLEGLPSTLRGLEFSKALRFLHEEELDLLQQVQDPRTSKQALPKYKQFTTKLAQFESTGLTAYALQAAQFAAGPGPVAGRTTTQKHAAASGLRLR